MEFIPVEDDLLSLEMDDVARDIYLVCPDGEPFLRRELTSRTATTRRCTIHLSAS
jgi:hypothetical protein